MKVPLNRWSWCRVTPAWVVVAGLALVACSRASTTADPVRSAELFVKPPTEPRVYGKAASTADGDSIRAVLTRYGAAWRARDATGVAAAYAEDAEWTNAFGRVMRDRAQLEAFLRGQLFTGQTGQPGRTVLDRLISFRFLGADAAIGHMYSETEGQVSPKGVPMGYRRVHNTIVLGRRAEGWRIVHHMIMDQRDTIP